MVSPKRKLTRRWGWLAVAVLGLATWAVQLPEAVDTWPPAYGDGASYIECARSLLAGQGLRYRHTFGFEPDQWDPCRIFPPGYPVVVAALDAVDLSTIHAAVAVSIASGAAVLLLVSWIAARMVPLPVAVGVVLVAACMSSFISMTMVAYSDALFMALAVGSLACAVRWSGRDASRWWLLACGVLAGLTWTVRYAAFALWGVLGLYVAAHLFYRRFDRVVLDAMALAGGVLAGASPVLVRNLWLFQKGVPSIRCRREASP